MQIIRDRDTLMTEIENIKRKQQTIGFVPTMGYLHDGHFALVHAAKAENDVVVMSLFVNPTQFGPDEDFESYPRDETKDIELAKEQGVKILFLPTVQTMYPESLTTFIQAQKRVSVLDGAARPGHFDGVLTVLAKLFHLVQPTHAYFGQKDAQQVAVVQGFVADYFFPIKLRVIPTVREDDGLAKSSRNVYLTEQERADAPVIHAALLRARELIAQKRDKAFILKETEAFINEKSTHQRIAYLDMYQFPSFEEISDWGKPIIIAVCVQYAKARLIDNEIIEGALT
ncbi:pantoate--beta-alanine ligase [Listeria weihenstephanensis FSL R9-0317]|uniref:Pantothenate synthetase n=1 Tax=Listeria weihenstephanensis TaxID=1006155 RepID=A0A1S7FTP0_9LIST|nr:pantoate--beta-alanine ligase [Listeria weihenstephanensis]AQY50811.1 pantoate--beta-alanine ligase [Listeria weihenstephanensis]EUJ35164.1 pantoate--beta-alanine ligase [Listeria weihenstephanensis FSL R9-0317]